jgi:hypothetical protein
MSKCTTPLIAETATFIAERSEDENYMVVKGSPKSKGGEDSRKDQWPVMFAIIEQGTGKGRREKEKKVANQLLKPKYVA